jgi:hypothetical protein
MLLYAFLLLFCVLYCTLYALHINQNVINTSLLVVVIIVNKSAYRVLEINLNPSDGG